MMMKEYFIGDFLKRIKRPISLESNMDYKLVTIKMKHNGVVLREKKKGALIKSGMYLVKEGDFILSGIDARNGAFGIISKELDNAIVTNDFWYFEIDENIISKQLFLELTSTSWFDEICKRGSDGTTQRIRLQKDKFFNQKVLLPKKSEQINLLKKILFFKQKQSDLKISIETRKKLIKQLKQSVFREAIQSKLTIAWREENPNIKTALKYLEKRRAEKKTNKEQQLQQIKSNKIPFELPKSWEWCKLGEIGEAIIGITYKPDQVGNIGIPILRSNNILDSRINFSNLIKVDTAISEKKITKKNDILICVRNGSKDLIGKSALIDKEGMSFGAFMTIFRSDFNSYLHIFFQSNIFKDQINDEKSTGINQLTQGVLNNIFLPLPSLEEQKVIVEKVESLIKSCNDLEKEIFESENKANLLMQIVLKEAFEVNEEI